MTCYTSRFLLFALLLYSSSDVISALLFRGELGSCLSVPSSNPSPVGEELRRLSVDVKRAVVASILSCPEFLAFSSARTVAKGKYTNTQLNKPVSHISEYNVAITTQKIQLHTRSTQSCTEALPAGRGGGWSHVARLNFKTSRVGVYKCLLLIVSFAVTVAIWPREVVSCRDFILCAVATFWTMSLVGIYLGRASVLDRAVLGLAEPRGPWHPTFAPGKNLSVFIQITCGTLYFTSSEHWAPFNFP